MPPSGIFWNVSPNLVSVSVSHSSYSVINKSVEVRQMCEVQSEIS